MTAGEALTRLQRAAIPSGPALPLHSATARAAEHLALPAGRPLPLALMERLRDRLHQAYRRYDWHRLQRAEWRLSPLVLWQGDPPLITLRGVFDRVRDRLKSDHGGVMARRLIQAWLTAYDEAMPLRAEAAATIRVALAANDAPALDPWRDAQRRFGLFSPESGPAAVAHHVLTAPGGVEQMAIALPLPPGPGGFRTGLIRHTLTAVSTELGAGTLAPEDLEPRLDAMGWTDGAPLTLRAHLATALLEPWAGREPAESVRRTILATLTRRLGPPPSWPVLAPDVTELLRRWRAAEALAYFFTMIGPDSGWRYRRAFWMAYANLGALDDAWLALPAELAANETERHGLLTGARRHQAALLLAIGPLVFVEWSPAGRCRAYLKDDPAAPSLGQASYAAAPLRRAGLRIVPHQVMDGVNHSGSEKWLWQGHLACFIAERTGIAIGREESMPD